jgi:hypothetical protein
MNYISQLESYIYKMESIDDEQSNKEDVDEASNETDVDDENNVTEDEIKFVKSFDNHTDYSRDWEKNLKIVQDIKKRLFNQQNNIHECMFKNHKKKSKQSKQSNKIDDEDDLDDAENMVQSNKDIDFIEIGNNVYLNKKTNKTYEIAPDDDLDDDEDLF